MSRTSPVVGVVPVVPALGTDVRAHVAVDEHGVGIRTPRTAEIDFLYAVGSGQLAVVEDIAEADITRG